jgi:hypothetical protein
MKLLPDLAIYAGFQANSVSVSTDLTMKLDTLKKIVSLAVTTVIT